MFNRKAVFLDRDGTLIEAVHRPGFRLKSGELKEITAPFTEDEVSLVPNAYSLLQSLKKAGFLRIMVTNQPDVAHGFLTEEVWLKIQRRVVDTLGLDDVFMCRHRTEDNCLFKKPSPLMLQSAADKWGINLSESYMVGDTDADMQSGNMAGCGTILLSKFYNLDDYKEADIVVPNLEIAIRAIVKEDEQA